MLATSTLYRMRYIPRGLLRGYSFNKTPIEIIRNVAFSYPKHQNREAWFYYHKNPRARSNPKSIKDYLVLTSQVCTLFQ